MPLTLEQYIERIHERPDLVWPASPKIEPPKAKPALPKLHIRGVMWTVYGTLVAISQGELLFEHPQDFVTEAALDKVIKEFKMWQSMSRKPGAPAAYLRELYRKALQMLQLSGGERYPEIPAERIWDDIVKKLQQKDYTFDAAIYGSLADYVQKIAYFYHASIQGVGPYPGAVTALQGLTRRGITQGLLTDGQCFTPGQLQRCLRMEQADVHLDELIASDLRILSAEKRARKPSETLFRAAVQALARKGLEPAEVLHVGSNLTRDIAPAKRFGFRTALFAGDRHSLVATPEQLRDPACRPDALLTELPQILELLP
ncbi:MAG: HAD family hydrolase [Thermogemmata sp.]|nr:HAD family hydrolase [Thermogemmata sp.]